MVNNLRDYKSSAVAFLQAAADGNVDKAFEIVAPHFLHHNPYFKPDATSLKLGMAENAGLHPDKVFEVQSVIGEGEMVTVHSRICMPSPGLTVAVVHIFRFEDGKLAELWDIAQAVPEQMINELGMF